MTSSELCEETTKSPRVDNEKEPVKSGVRKQKVVDHEKDEDGTDPDGNSGVFTLMQKQGFSFRPGIQDRHGAELPMRLVSIAGSG